MGGAQAQELDTAQQFYFKVRDFMGEVNFAQIDTTDEVRSAVNAGLRAVAMEIGITGRDTITLVSGTYFYSLQSNYMADGLPHKPLKVIRVSADGQSAYEMREVEPGSYGFTSSQSALSTIGPEAAGYSFVGNRIWITPPHPGGDKIHIEGPISAVPHDTSLSIEATVPEDDRMAVVYFAISILAHARVKPQMAAFYYGLWQTHVATRRGQIMQQEGP